MTKSLSQSEHERINSREYPGTRQLCSWCEEPTGHCEEDALWTISDDPQPLCHDCYHLSLAANAHLPELLAVFRELIDMTKADYGALPDLFARREHFINFAESLLKTIDDR